MTAFRAVVLEHFRHPRNRRPVENATANAEGANPLCGDRIRIQVRVERDAVIDAGFTADACALCVASASLLTEHVRGMPLGGALAVDGAWIDAALHGSPPPGRTRCSRLPLETLHRALAAATPR